MAEKMVKVKWRLAGGSFGVNYGAKGKEAAYKFKPEGILRNGEPVEEIPEGLAKILKEEPSLLFKLKVESTQNMGVVYDAKGNPNKTEGHHKIAFIDEAGEDADGDSAALVEENAKLKEQLDKYKNAGDGGKKEDLQARIVQLEDELAALKQ